MSNDEFAESKMNICWKSRTNSIWKDDVDSLDRMVAKAHSEATVYDVITRSENPVVPTQENIDKAVKSLDENSSWRSDPFSLIQGAEKDPDIIEITERLQMKSIRDLWNSDDEVSQKITNPVKSVPNVKKGDPK